MIFASLGANFSLVSISYQIAPGSVIITGIVCMGFIKLWFIRCKQPIYIMATCCVLYKCNVALLTCIIYAPQTVENVKN